MLFWKSLSCSIFVSSQNWIFFFFFQYHALLDSLAQWHRGNGGSLVSLTGLSLSKVQSVAVYFLWGLLPCSIRDISQGTVYWRHDVTEQRRTSCVACGSWAATEMPGSLCCKCLFWGEARTSVASFWGSAPTSTFHPPSGFYYSTRKHALCDAWGVGH